MNWDTRDGMPRRRFLAAAGAAQIGAAMSVLGRGQTVAANESKEGQSMKRCRYWMHGLKGDAKPTAKALKEAGFDIVVAGGKATIDAVREQGMDSWLCGGAFGLGKLKKDDSVKAKDLKGDPQIWFGSGCPNNPRIRKQNLKSYEKMAATEGIQGILVDGCRFASPASGLNPYFTCFCNTCRKKAGEVDIDFKRMKQDVQALYDAVTDRTGGKAGRGSIWFRSPTGLLEWLTDHPGVLDWYRFRRICSTEHFRDVGKIIHDANLQMGVYIFTPSLSPLVGQSYVDLREFVDVFAPMIYRNYPKRPGPACLNWEVTIIPEELGLTGKPAEKRAMELILTWTGLADVVKDRTIAKVRKAMPPEAVGHETAMARALIGKDKELAPIIYIDDPKMKTTAELVRKSGADGVNFFVFQDEWAKLVKPGIVN